jgi:hypothetical protein
MKSLSVRQPAHTNEKDGIENETFGNKKEIFMKVVITGSLGNISKPLAHELVAQGHAVKVISSKPEKQTDIEALGATAAIGSRDRSRKH